MLGNLRNYPENLFHHISDFKFHIKASTIFQVSDRPLAVTPAYEMYEQLSFTIHVLNLSDSLLFPFRVALISLPSGLFTRISVTL